MTITRGKYVKNLALYPPAQPSLSIIKIRKQHVSYLMENMRPPLTIENALDFKDQTEDDIINSFINKPQIRYHLQCHMIKATFENKEEEDPLKDIPDQVIPTTFVYNSKVV